MARSRSFAFSFVVVTTLAGCSDSPTAPTPDFDGSLHPYRVTVAGVRTFGTSRLLVIPAMFRGGAPPPLGPAEIHGQLFGGANGGPVNESFQLASGGGFRLRGVVTRWVLTSLTPDLSGPGVFTPSAGEDYVFEALQAVEGDIDFGLFDNDGPDGFPNSGDDDGVVDGGVAILNSELNRYCDGGTGRGPHPFARRNWNLNGLRYRTADPSANGGVIEVGGYTLGSVIGCGGTTVASHVLAHELGHLFFGLPDLYHAIGGTPGSEVWQQRRWVSGCWELMAAGGWGCGTGAPTLDYRFNSLGAWSRAVLGWATPVVVDPGTSSTHELHPLDRGGTVLRVPITADEYLLIEYREATAGDTRIPSNGVLIFHVAESLPQFPPTLQSSYRVSLIEADDDSALFRTELQGGNRGTASDAFGGARNALRPGEHSRARAVDGTPFPFQVTEISIDAAAHRARVRIGPAVASNARKF